MARRIEAGLGDRFGLRRFDILSRKARHLHGQRAHIIRSAFAEAGEQRRARFRRNGGTLGKARIVLMAFAG